MVKLYKTKDTEASFHNDEENHRLIITCATVAQAMNAKAKADKLNRTQAFITLMGDNIIEEDKVYTSLVNITYEVDWPLNAFNDQELWKTAQEDGAFKVRCNAAGTWACFISPNGKSKFNYSGKDL